MALQLLGAAMLLGCATTRSSTQLDRHVVPNGISQASLEGFDVVSFLDVDLHTAVQTRAAVESEFGVGYGRAGHPRWFFHSFDRTNLDFVVARYSPSESSQPRYVAERRLRVKRTRRAESALGVGAVVREYEISRGH